MSTTSNFTLLQVEVNKLINNTLAGFERTGHKDGIWRHLRASEGRIRIQPSYSTQFYGVELLIEAAQKYGYSFFIGTEENLNGDIAPYIHIYPAAV